MNKMTTRHAARSDEAPLRGFQFYTEYGLITGAENVSVAIGVDAERGLDDYERTYRLEDEDRAMFVAGGSEIDGTMNAALSHVIGQVLDDRDFMRFLAGSRGAAAIAY